jgi:diacylglycerol kinase family enzyme
MHRIVVIANPSASQFTGGAHRDVMATLERAEETDVEAVWPDTAADAQTKAALAVEAGADIVVAMGGDGIVHHVAQGLVGTSAALGIVPAGTTNVVARLLGLPLKPVKAARILFDGERRSIGTARMTLTRGTVETVHHSVFACGFGLDASVVAEAEKDPYRKYRFGSVHYARSALGVVLGEFPGRKADIELVVEDEKLMVTSAQVQFREAYTYFGRIGLRVGTGDPDPMSVLAIGRLKRRRIPRILTTLLRHGDLSAIPELTVFTDVESLGFRAPDAVAAQADGEALGLADAGQVDWSPDSLRVVVPAPSP